MRTKVELRIGRLEAFSALDWPGRLVATVFCQGCGWRCRYCHSPDLRVFRAGQAGDDEWTWPAVSAWLRDRRGLLDGVVFSGGEPTLQPDLPAAMGQARELGFRVGLHTGGQAPDALERALPLADWVGFDLKAPLDGYAKVTGLAAGGGRVARSLRLVRESGVECEVRTTWHPAMLTEEDLAVMAESLAAEGFARWVLQFFRPEGCADPELRDSPVGPVPSVVFGRPGVAVCVR